MRYYLSETCALKWLETPSVYNIKTDELYELDAKGFEFLKASALASGCDALDADPGFVDYCMSEGILKTGKVSFSRPGPVKSDVPSLRYLELQITDRCNLKCRHCYLGSPQNRELSIGGIRRVLDDFYEMQGLRLLVTGGEPLMHSRFAVINDMLSGYLFRKILFTNGLMLDKAIIKGLNFDEIQFSIDGMERGHDALRGKGTYRILMARLNDALDTGIETSVATMVHSQNLDEFEEMSELFSKIRIKDWTVDTPCFSGNLKHNGSMLVSPEIAGRLMRYGFGSGLHGGGEGYGCGLHLAAVTPSGDICKCAFYTDRPAENIENGLRKGWALMKPTFIKDLECYGAGCAHIDECRGGCRFRAELCGGRNSRDIYKCHEFGIINT
ncbi:MAG: radical SAM protein [Nitrospirae bacterium]|nr:MAG: radical SAM protein [Nitrospirota bacterium]